jgi:hypothetical protein
LGKHIGRIIQIGEKDNVPSRQVLDIQLDVRETILKTLG